MNTKMLLASLAAGVASFFIGWVVWGMLLHGYYEANMNPIEGYERPMEEMNMKAMILANLIWGVLAGWSLWRMGVTTAMAGAMAGGILFALIAAGMDMFFLAMTYMYANTTIIVVDVIVNAAVGAVIGAIVGLILGSGAKA